MGARELIGLSETSAKRRQGSVATRNEARIVVGCWRGLNDKNKLIAKRDQLPSS
jgi:hypothetical protein